MYLGILTLIAQTSAHYWYRYRFCIFTSGRSLSYQYLIGKFTLLSVIFLTIKNRVLTLLPICTRHLFTSIVSTVIQILFNRSRSGVRLTIFFRFYLRDVMRKSVKFIIIWTKRLRKAIDILSVTICFSDQKTGYHNLKKMGTQLSFS